MEKSVLTAIERFSLLENTSEITVALSGGADSMSLLYALNSLKEHLGITLYAAHLNHMIRGKEAVRDEEFVKRACKSSIFRFFANESTFPPMLNRKN